MLCFSETSYRCVTGFILPGLPSQALTRQLTLPLSLARHLPPAGGSLSKGEPLAKRYTLRGLPRPPTLGKILPRCGEKCHRR